MENERAVKADELHDIIDVKLIALFQELQDAGWNMDEVALTIGEILKKQWLDRIAALQVARQAVSKGFQSDGNEG